MHDYIQESTAICMATIKRDYNLKFLRHAQIKLTAVYWGGLQDFR